MSQKKTVIINGLVFDGHELHQNLAVAIENGVISNLGNVPDTSYTTIIDATGQTLLPGLIDAHVHLTADLENTCHLLTQMARAGITTALDMGYLPKPIRDAVRDQPGMTDIRAAGNYATSTGSTHSRFPHISKESLVDSSELAISFVQTRIAEDAEYIKIVADIPGPSQEVVDTLAAEARKAGKLSVAHAARKGSFAMAQEGKVDIVTHVPLDFPLDEDEAKKMKDEGRVCVPTLIMEQGLAKAGIFPGLDYTAARESVSRLHKAGVSIVVGTDANQSPRAGVRHGDAIHEELKLLVDAGMSNLEVLRGATSASAEAFRLYDRGVIAVGKRADLVLVNGNPAESIGCTKDMVRVWIHGEEVKTRD
ncbi:hydrolase [Mollisia scopiformis]|uniref:Hydrolase n=1 Tax=Mollisia scopiformis TaxID=149040 RepID=A0A194WXD2_MOLSC|nr:hydrolase [Mollisia scopiformis]KUJ12636.1 hydrolase [Mollisia scopiformis]